MLIVIFYELSFKAEIINFPYGAWTLSDSLEISISERVLDCSYPSPVISTSGQIGR